MNNALMHHVVVEVVHDPDGENDNDENDENGYDVDVDVQKQQISDVAAVIHLFIFMIVDDDVVS